MEYLSSYTDSLYLAHHGIKGQKWGVRRFQNEDGSLTKSGKERYSDEAKEKGFHLTDKQKKYLKIGLAVAGTALAAYGGYKISQGFDITRMPNFDPTSKLLKKNKVLDIAEDVKNVNPNAKTGLQKYLTNCSKCSATYDLRRRGFDVTAAAEKNGFGQPLDAVAKYFKNATSKNVGFDALRAGPWGIVKTLDPSNMTGDDIKSAVSKASYFAKRDPMGYRLLQDHAAKELVHGCESFGPGARGHIALFFGNGGGHSIAFENTKDGKVRFRDTQIANLMSDAGDSGINGEYYKKYICNNNPFIQMKVTRTDNAEPNYEYLLKNNIIKNNFNPLDSPETQLGAGLAVAGLAVAGGAAISAIRTHKKAKQNAQKNLKETS